MVASQPDSPGTRRGLLVNGVWVVGGFGGFALDASDDMDVGPSGSRVNVTASVESNQRCHRRTIQRLPLPPDGVRSTLYQLGRHERPGELEKPANRPRHLVAITCGREDNLCV